MSLHSEVIKEVTGIISRTENSPTIINPESKFVVVTYWWGRGNYNGNTARPCMAFYEEFIQNIIKIAVNTGNTLYSQKNESILKDNFIETLLSVVLKIKPFENIIDKTALNYLYMIYEFCGIKINLSKDTNQEIRKANIETVKCLERKRGQDVPENFSLYSKYDL